MIYIGLAGWGDHPSLYKGTGTKKGLDVYSSYFPIVELDSSFYAIQPKRNMEKWVRETPDSFQFIVKAFQGMTTHQQTTGFESKEEMFDAFLDSIQPMEKADKLGMVLCQFPPWFDCKKENVQYLRYMRERLSEIPLALEFRHQSWFLPEVCERTLSFMNDEEWIHSICDEPQAGMGSVPIILKATNPKKTLIRFHGRNLYGWNDPGDGRWREVRYLYRYNSEELKEWQVRLSTLNKESEDIYIIFNNNSGGDAAENALEFISMLEIDYKGLNPRQLDLF
ncbi:DUF72 domain-containing protein [Bacillus solitudinis]|uniref:DUF72 domain-containing protein n=1 Tax=Bacillus solitudinis TaxID=2014074 RepID=UPI000C23D037|nr:DUF72 domain-containing protein [Bacillus solitudinis]